MKHIIKNIFFLNKRLFFIFISFFIFVKYKINNYKKNNSKIIFNYKISDYLIKIIIKKYE